MQLPCSSMLYFFVLTTYASFSVFLASSVESVTKTCGDREGGWAIGMVSGPDPFHLSAPTRQFDKHFPCLRNPIITCNSVSDVSASFVADPFLYIPSPQAKEWYLFFEVKNTDPSLRRRHGQIGAAVSKDKGQSWQYLQIVLRQPFHMAFPQVFEHEGSIYMLPEQWSRLTLYKAVNFPTVWKAVKYLHNSPKIDPSIVMFQGVWWMFALIEHGRSNFAHVLYADSPLGPWHDHPHNCHHRPRVGKTGGGEIECIGGHNVTTPHAHGPARRFTGARSGGRAFVYQDKLYRVVQHSKKSYGDGLDLYEVTVVSKTELLEQTLISDFNAQYRTPNNIGLWNLARYHHLDLHQTVNEHGMVVWVGVMDGDGFPTGDKRNQVPDNTTYYESEENMVEFQRRCAS